MSNGASANRRSSKIKVEGDGSIGNADRSAIVQGDGNSVYIGHRMSVDDGDEPVDANPPSSSSGFKWGGFAIFGVAMVVLCGFVYNAPELKSSFPSENGSRPTGSNDSAVLQEVLAGLQSCAQAVVLKPLNCPQQVGDWGSGDAKDVSWELHGVPGDGAIVVYNGEEGRFHVLGTAVMTASYRTSVSDELRLRTINYWARVEWVADKARLAELRNYDDSPKPATPKRDPGVPGDILLSITREAFGRCVSAKRSPLPPGCPPGNAATPSDKAKWNLNGNPTINAKASFDAATGLIHVVGNYSMTLAYKMIFIGQTSQPYSGEYDAVISVDDGKPKVLSITGK